MFGDGWTMDAEQNDISARASCSSGASREAMGRAAIEVMQPLKAQEAGMARRSMKIYFCYKTVDKVNVLGVQLCLDTSASNVPLRVKHEVLQL